MTFNVAIVGLGYWGPNLLRNFYEANSCRVKYGCDLREDILKKFSIRYPNVKFTTHYSEILNDEDLDIIAIATPVSTHFKLAQLALLHDKHVLIEKPMAQSVKECTKLMETAIKKKLILMVDHTFIFTGAVKNIKEIISNKELGDIYYFDSERINLGLLQNDVNVIWDLAPHDIAIMYYLLSGSRPIRLLATGTKHINSKLEEMAHITTYFDSGIVGHIHVSWLSPLKIRKILIGGSKKMIVYNDIEPSEKVKIYDKGISLHVNDVTPFKPAYRSGDVYIPRLDNAEALKVEIEHFLECIEKQEQPITDGVMGLNVVKVLEACDLSLSTGKEVTL